MEPTSLPNELDQAIFAWMQEMAPEGICVTDDQLQIQVWNSWLEAKSGLSKEKVIGRKLFDVFPDLEGRRLHVYFQRALKGEVSILSVAFHKYLFDFPSPIRNAAFPHMLQTARMAPLLQEGKVIGTLTTIQDVTEREHQNAALRKQHERQELLAWALAHLMQSSHPEMMVKEIFPRISAHIEVDVYCNYLVDEQNKLRLHSSGGFSQEVQEKFGAVDFGVGLTGASASKRETIYVGDIQQSRDPLTEGARKLGFQAFVCHPLAVGEKLIGTLSFASFHREKFAADEIEFTKLVAQYVAIAIERARTLALLNDAQARLGNYAGSLETTVQQRTSELQDSLQALESFSYTLAHDVRAPLRHIRGYAEALSEDCGDRIGDAGRTYITSICEGIARLDALTNDILSYGQLSRQNSPKSVIDLETLLRRIILAHPGLHAPGAITLQEPLHNPFAEPFLLEQCLNNLLENALKFVPTGVAPRIVVHTELKSGWVRIFVDDNGIGISPEFHHKIFGVFERLPTPEPYEGTGIGLAIVARATQQMGGKFGVESMPARGSRFWIELPAAHK